MSQISDVEVYPLKKEHSKVKANGSFVYGGVVKVRYTLMNGSNGLFVSLPGRKGKDGEGNDKWYSDVYILDENTRKELQATVVTEYNKKTGNELNQGDAEGPTNQTQSNVPF